VGWVLGLAETRTPAVSHPLTSRRRYSYAARVVELVADKLPRTPRRTAPPGLIARIVMGGLTGACVAASGAQGIFLGILLGAAGGVAGCFLGYRARTGLVKALGTRDIYIALVEDLVAIAGSLWVVSQF
jgi:uncharacterized membrane protein